ncbi:hypothetical protein ACSI5G_003995 [Vibrio vulnificus]|nr:hypothetical protein [Vibrio vulnificus]HAS8118910.1 hypothetical protein [Vibrio vulnificus]
MSELVAPYPFATELRDQSIAESVRVVLVGLGPHAKRIYMHYLAALGLQPALIIELESQKDCVEKYLDEKGLSADCLYISDSSKYQDTLSQLDAQRVFNEVARLGISHAIIATEPKAHLAYIRFFLKSNLMVLCDKPITATKDLATSISSAQKLTRDYDEIKQSIVDAQVESHHCVIQCQRRWHKGYLYIKRLLQQEIAKHSVPITSIELYHCDGMWNMPNEFFLRENHPYKYGYGKLMHSGYHFIDLLCWLLDENNHLDKAKPDNAELYTATTNPYDYMGVVDNDMYKNLLGTEMYKDIIANRDRCKPFGEIDFNAIVQFKKSDSVVTTATLNLIQNGFSRRSWARLPEDTYKGNGRVRHERINIQLGPLMNIQVHSYQSVEISERRDKFGPGEVEHFDISVYRNTELIGGEPYQKIRLCDIVDNDGSDFIGYNEMARKECIRAFLSNEPSIASTIDEHELPNKLLSKCYESIVLRSTGHNPVVTFGV